MLDPLFKPRSVAVIGASERRLTLGYQILHNLIVNRFTGKVYPVNPKAESILDHQVFPSILDVPGEVDLAHIILKNTLVPQVVEQCGRKGVKVVIVNTAGFREIGREGEALEQEMLKVARQYGVRIFGPNCQGVMNSDDAIRLYSNFTFTPLRKGKISLIAQSGGVGEVLNNRLMELDAGVRMYASNGNAADISIPEILRYMGKDEETRVICLHIESLADPGEFLEAASEVTQRVPVLAFKTGRTEAGAKAVASHTGILLQQNSITRLIFEKAGVIPFTSHEEMCQAAIGFATQPIPKGRGVGIITNTGGPAIIATDEVIEAGLEIPSLPAAIVDRLKQELHSEASVRNPVDVLATGDPEHYAATIEELLNEDSIHAILLHFVTPFFIDCPAVAEQIAAVGKKANKPILSVVMTNKKLWAETIKAIRASGIPTYDYPETAARVLASMARYQQFRQSVVKRIYSKPKGISKKKALSVLSRHKGFSGMLPAADTYELLQSYGIHIVPFRVVDKPEEVPAAAEELGYPVVLKIDSPSIIHKSDVGGVALAIKDSEQLNAALTRMVVSVNAPERRFLLQRYLPGGVEVIAGAKAESGIGNVLMFGLGGMYVEIFKDVAFALGPLSQEEARRMIESIKYYPMLEGARGSKGVDIAVLEDMLLRLSQLMNDFPRLREIDLNPIAANEPGKDSPVLDARIIVAAE